MQGELQWASGLPGDAPRVAQLRWAYPRKAQPQRRLLAAAVLLMCLLMVAIAIPCFSDML